MSSQNQIPTISSAKCREMLEEHITALKTVLKGQSYSIGGRSLSRANMKDIQDGIDYWTGRLENALELEARGGRRGVVVRAVIPHG